MSSAQETVLVFGATGNIGSSVIIAALRTGRKVLAVVRNDDSARKMFAHLSHVPNARGSITTAEADVMSENGVKGIVDRVRAGELPNFQHVYLSIGQLFLDGPLHEITTETLHSAIQVNIAANFYAYRATIPYLLAQNEFNSTFTIITGAAADYGFADVTAISQSGLIGLTKVAAKQNEESNIRFNEIYLAYRVDYDSVWEEKGGKDCTKSSDFAKHYEAILSRPDIRSSRVWQTTPADLENIRYEKAVKSRGGH